MYSDWLASMRAHALVVVRPDSGIRRATEDKGLNGASSPTVMDRHEPHPDPVL